MVYKALGAETNMHMIKYVQQPLLPVVFFFLFGILSSTSGNTLFEEISGDISSITFDTLRKTYFVTLDISWFGDQVKAIQNFLNPLY